MPILRRKIDGGLIIRGFVREAHGFCTWQVSAKGVDYLKKIGYRPDERLPNDAFQHLLEQKYAFTAKSGIIEASITPETINDPTQALPVLKQRANIAEDDAKVYARWLPRLTDRSDKVREQASINLGKLAVRSPVLREQLVPLLLDFTAEEQLWHVLFNGLYFYGEFGQVPKTDPKWIDSFVDVFLEIGIIPHHKQFGAWRELQRLITETGVPLTWPRFGEVLETAQRSLPGSTDSSRMHILALTDWIEDHV